VTGLVLASALLHATWNALIKGGRDPLIGTAALSACWAIVGLALLPWVGRPEPAAWPYLAGSVAVHVVYAGALSAAYRHGDLSLVYPVARGLPPFLIGAAGALLGREAVGPAMLVGIALITAGVLSLAQTGPAGGWRSPALGRDLITACLIAAYTALDGVGARRSENSIGYVVWLSTTQGWLFLLCVFAVRRRELVRALPGEMRFGFPAGILAAGGYALVLWCMTQAPIAAVAALRETAVLFGVGFGVLWLGEPLGRRRVVAAALIAAGAALVQTAR
jgi:drug/metabolite transporter (DMT)-like permease